MFAPCPSLAKQSDPSDQGHGTYVHTYCIWCVHPTMNLLTQYGLRRLVLVLRVIGLILGLNLVSSLCICQELVSPGHLSVIPGRCA